MLTSGSAARGLLALGPDDATRARLLATPVVSIGSPTAEVARSLGFSTLLVSPSPDPSSLADFVAAALGIAPMPVNDTDTGPEPALSGGSR